MVAIPRQRDEERTPRRTLTNAKRAEIVRDVLTEGWQATVADQLATALNDELWRSVPRRRSGTVDCKVLADLADEVEKLKKTAHNVVGKVVARAAAQLGRSSTEQQILSAFAQKIPLPGDEQADAFVHALRVTGVFVCLVGGEDVLRVCPCFRALAMDKTKEELTELLEQKLDEVVAGYSKSGPSHGEGLS